MREPQARTILPPPILHRVAHRNGGLRFAEIDALDAELPDVGNRFDVVGGGVLYAATERVGAFKEVLSSFRPSPAARRYASASSEHFMQPGAVSAEWRRRRTTIEFALEEPLPFLDVERDETLSFLASELAEVLDGLGIASLDASIVRGPNRLVTRAIAAWAYTAVDADDEAAYSGIRYLSRFQSHECWAVFEGVELSASRVTSAIERDDPDLAQTARDFHLTVH